MEPPPPANGIRQHTTQCETDREPNRLPTAHGREGVVPALAMKSRGDDADCRRQAKSNGDTAETAENDQLISVACQSTSKGKERLEDGSDLVHEPRAKSVRDGAGE